MKCTFSATSTLHFTFLLPNRLEVDRQALLVLPGQHPDPFSPVQEPPQRRPLLRPEGAPQPGAPQPQ